MKMKTLNLILTLALLAGVTQQLHAQGTAFAYQGRLNSGGSPANGLYDYRFKLYTDPLGNTQVGSSYSTNAIAVTNGLFVTTIDFGAGIFTGGTNWLEVDVRTNGAGSYTVLSPLQGVTPTPNAIFAETAGNVSGTVSAAQLSGAVANGNLPSSPTVSGTVTAGSFAGNGANLTNVNAVTLNGLSGTNFWQLGGNSVAWGQFLGSTNNQPLYLEANGHVLQQLAYANDPTYGYAPNLIGGYSGNFASNGVVGGFIGGGGNPTWPNILGGSYSSIPGGNLNMANGNCSLAMGTWCTANGSSSMAVGYHNIANGGYSLALGQGNTVGGTASVALGWGNSTAFDGGVAIGADNIADGNDGFAIGINNEANGTASFALGNGAESLHQGTFVWADDAQTGPFASTGNNQFLIRASGGMAIGTNAPAGALEVASASSAPQLQVEQQNPDYARIRLHAFTNAFWDFAAQSPLNIYSSVYGNVMTLQNNGAVGISVGNPGHYLDVGGRIRLRQEGSGNSAGLWLYQNGPANDRAFVGMDNDGYMGFWGNQGAAWGLVMNTTNSFVGIANTSPTAYLQVVNATCNGSSWVNASDRNLKQDFAPVDPVAVLAKVVSLPVQSWDYKAQPDEKHIGPVAQDFHAAFGLNGADDKHIATVDEGGVALAAIQGLNRKLEAENTELKARLNELEATVKVLAERK